MFENTTEVSKPSSILLALAASLCLHAVASVGLAGVQLPAPGAWRLPDGGSTPTVAVTVEDAQPVGERMVELFIR